MQLEKSYNHALHDFMMFIDPPLNFRFEYKLLDTKLFLLHLTHPTLGIEPDSRIEVCDYSKSSVLAALDTRPR